MYSHHHKRNPFKIKKVENAPNVEERGCNLIGFDYTALIPLMTGRMIIIRHIGPTAKGWGKRQSWAGIWFAPDTKTGIKSRGTVHNPTGATLRIARWLADYWSVTKMKSKSSKVTHTRTQKVRVGNKSEVSGVGQHLIMIMANPCCSDVSWQWNRIHHEPSFQYIFHCKNWVVYVKKAVVVRRLNRLGRYNDQTRPPSLFRT